MPTILHISDVHFGPPHRPEVADAVARLVARRRPDLVALSGDLTQRAKGRQFREARAFVDRLEAPVLAVPGNHDVPLYRFWERLASPLGAYRRNFSQDLDPVFRGPGLVVAGVNSARRLTLTGGRVKVAQLQRVEAVMLDAPGDALKVVVVHHHVVPPPRFGAGRPMRRAEAAIESFSRTGVELVLSGHQHQAYQATSEQLFPRSRPPVLIVHSGTTTSARGRGGEADRNTCNWIEADGASIRVSVLVWDGGHDGFLTRSRHRYPRRAVKPYSLGDRPF